jgi:AcrR family transcriptional regulator
VNIVYLLVVPQETERTPRERRHDGNLRRILDTAMSMVEEGGFDALSLHKLAEAVDYTPGALYRYFGSKDALLARLVERILEDVGGHLTKAQALLPPTAPPLARVFVLVSAYREFARREPHRFGLLAMTMAEPRVLLTEAADAEPVAMSVMATLSPLADAVLAATSAKQLGPGDVAERTICLFSLLQGVLQLHKQARYAPAFLDLDRLTLNGTRALLVGWGAKPKAIDAALAHLADLGDLAPRLGATS